MDQHSITNFKKKEDNLVKKRGRTKKLVRMQRKYRNSVKIQSSKQRRGKMLSGAVYPEPRETYNINNNETGW